MRSELALVRPFDTYRPFLQEAELDVALCRLDYADGIGDDEIALFDLLDLAGDAVRDHYLMEHHRSLLDPAYDVAAYDLVALLDGRFEVPLLFAGHRISESASRDAGAVIRHQLFERSLDAVVDVADEARSQFYGERFARRDRGFARGYARGLFVYLNGSPVASHFDYLAYQPGVAYLRDVIEVGVLHSVCDDQRAGDLYYPSLFHRSPSFPASEDANMSAPTACSTAAEMASMPMPRLPLLPGIMMMAGDT